MVKDPVKDMIEPSTAGVKNILSSVNKNPRIRHFVQTSSMAAVGGAARRVDESDWNTEGYEGWDAPGTSPAAGGSAIRCWYAAERAQ